MGKSISEVKGGQQLINSFFTVLSDVTNIPNENRIESINNNNISIPPLPIDTPTNDENIINVTNDTNGNNGRSIRIVSNIKSKDNVIDLFYDTDDDQNNDVVVVPTTTTTSNNDNIAHSIYAYGTVASTEPSKPNRKQNRRSLKRNCTKKRKKCNESSDEETYDDNVYMSSKKYKNEHEENIINDEEMIYVTNSDDHIEVTNSTIHTTPNHTTSNYPNQTPSLSFQRALTLTNTNPESKKIKSTSFMV